MTPRLWVFAGPNGAGKSTIVDHFVGNRIPIINPDNIARTLAADLGDGARVIQSGRIAVRERAALLAAGRTFGIETTLTGRSEVDLMRAASAAGYQVNLIYIGLRDVRHSIGRVSERVRQGGHAVPMADLWRRFDRSIANLRTAMTIANHRVLLIDNSSQRRRLLFSSKAGRIKYRSPTPPVWAASAISSERASAGVPYG